MPRIQPGSRRLSLYLSPIVGAALGLCLACATAASTQPTTPSSAAWTLTFDMTGGFAGLDRRLELTSDGSATVNDRRRRLTRAAKATDGELKAIGALVATVRSLDSRAPGCRDCFEYALDLQSGGARVTVRANDTGMGGDSAKLLDALRELMTRILSSEPQ
jgi:hypothetical protein